MELDRYARVFSTTGRKSKQEHVIVKKFAQKSKPRIVGKVYSIKVRYNAGLIMSIFAISCVRVCARTFTREIDRYEAIPKRKWARITIIELRGHY